MASVRNLEEGLDRMMDALQSMFLFVQKLPSKAMRPEKFYGVQVRLGYVDQKRFMPGVNAAVLHRALTRFDRYPKWTSKSDVFFQQHDFVYRDAQNRAVCTSAITRPGLGESTSTVTKDGTVLHQPDPPTHIELKHFVRRKVRWEDVPLGISVRNSHNAEVPLMVRVMVFVEEQVDADTLPQRVAPNRQLRMRVRQYRDFTYREEWAFRFMLVWDGENRHQTDSNMDNPPCFETVLECTDHASVLSRYNHDLVYVARSMLLKTMDMLCPQDKHMGLVNAACARSTARMPRVPPARKRVSKTRGPSITRTSLEKKGKGKRKGTCSDKSRPKENTKGNVNTRVKGRGTRVDAARVTAATRGGTHRTGNTGGIHRDRPVRDTESLMSRHSTKTTRTAHTAHTAHSTQSWRTSHTVFPPEGISPDTDPAEDACSTGDTPARKKRKTCHGTGPDGGTRDMAGGVLQSLATLQL